MQVRAIKATVKIENSLWIVIFEKINNSGYAVARAVFGSEPTDPEVYNYISNHFYQLRFTQPQDFELIIKRKNPKRIQREVKRDMEKIKLGLFNTTMAQEALRIELEKNKKEKKVITKQEKIAQLQGKLKYLSITRHLWLKINPCSFWP